MELCNGRKSENDQRVISLTTFQFQDVRHCHYLRHELLLRSVFAFYFLDIQLYTDNEIRWELFQCIFTTNAELILMLEKYAEKLQRYSFEKKKFTIHNQYLISKYQLLNAVQYIQ